MIARNFILRDRNESFVCDNCKANVKKHPSSARNHCPQCLASKHVDGETPGDRLSKCEGIMLATSLEKHPKATYRLVHQCQKCGFERTNIAAPDDNFESLLTVAKQLARDLD